MIYKRRSAKYSLAERLFLFLCLLLVFSAITGCSDSVVITAPRSTIMPQLMELPIVEFESPSDEDVRTARLSTVSIQSIISVYDDRTQTSRTIIFNDSVLMQKGRNRYVVINYSKSDQIFVTVSFPLNFSVQQYEITQIVGVSYQVDDPSFSGAIFRALPLELPPLGEPETAGEACNQTTFGQLTITSEQPVQGNFQFNCQFQDGFYASLAGVFSQ